jgi:hypothetical protein
MMHIHWHKLVKRSLVHDYVQCRCGSRYARQIHGSINGPADSQWLNGGHFTTKAEREAEVARMTEWMNTCIAEQRKLEAAQRARDAILRTGP